MLKVTTFNLKHNLLPIGGNAWKKRLSSIVSCINSLSPDILGTQELVSSTLTELSSKLSGYQHYGLGRYGKAKGEFTTIFYKADRFEFLDGETFWLSKTPQTEASRSWFSAYPRICTVVKLLDKVTERRIAVYNTHLDNISWIARKNGLKLIRKRIDEQYFKEPKTAIIFMGDFNLKPTSKALRYLTVNDGGIILSSSYNLLIKNQISIGASFHGFSFGIIGKTMPIDYIFTSKHLNIHSTSLNKSRIGDIYPSDHFPVTSIMSFNKNF